MQVTNAVVARAERAERAALTDLHTAAPAAVRERLGLENTERGGALVSLARHAPTILVNRVLGLGVTERADKNAVRDIVETYRRANLERYFLHVDPNIGQTNLTDWLSDAGLSPYHRSWTKFFRGVEPPPPVSNDLEVRRIGPEHAADFGRIAASAFEIPQAWATVIQALVGHPGWHAYLSFDRDVPAGCGAMRIVDNTAWFDWGATLPEFRGRGSQSAILARRVEDAIALGCNLLVTCTGESVPGDPQHSYRNILRSGFERGYERQNWTPS